MSWLPVRVDEAALTGGKKSLPPYSPRSNSEVGIAGPLHQYFSEPDYWLRAWMLAARTLLGALFLLRLPSSSRSPSPTYEMHGHLRSTIIGDAVTACLNT
jgi:hypothetical protein